MSRRAPRRASWTGRGDLTASLVVIMPLVLAYGLGVLATGHLSVIDVPTRLLWRACGRDRNAYLLVHAGLAACYLVWVARRARRDLLGLQVIGPLLLEATVVALALLALLEVVLRHGPLLGALDRVVASLGAGLHEELVFRLGAFFGGAWLLGRAGVPARAGWWLALVGSTVLFAAAHHWAGEPWSTAAFEARCIAGLVFALVAWHRSLAHAVYAHAAYDLIVTSLR
ncbi:MAG TPA: CPBP family glutamic-type intramembrane protease [Kofleriaceae bacterium]|nr:CPBP family glutamic-type intramembrane protease [Kofleriaceae bacterium]